MLIFKPFRPVARRVARALHAVAGRLERAASLELELQELPAAPAPAPAAPTFPPSMPAREAAPVAHAERKPSKKRRRASPNAALAEELIAKHGSRRAAAEASGICETQLGRWRRGAPMTAATARRIRRALAAPVLEAAPIASTPDDDGAEQG